MRGRIRVPTPQHEDVVSGWGLGCGGHSWSPPCQGLLLSSLRLCVGLPTPGQEGGDQEFPNHPPGGARVRRGAQASLAVPCSQAPPTLMGTITEPQDFV